MQERIQQLCASARQGDEKAASELVELFQEKVFAYLARLCGHPEEAADLTQKTFCQVWKALPNFQNRSSFSTWVHGIARHVYLDWRRKRNLLDDQPPAWWEHCLDDTPSPFEDAAERDHARLLYHFVELLDESAREVVHLHYYQGLSIKETAGALDIATSTVKYRLRQALDVLRSKTADPLIRPSTPSSPLKENAYVERPKN
jgi:RNA polymerase sigma-70 factor, ECF subfamily